MRYLEESNSTPFFVVGLSYRKADAEIRGKFSIKPDNQTKLLKRAQELGIKSTLLISTCNRTEIYGFAPSEDLLLALLVHFSEGDLDLLRKSAFIRKGPKAVKHLFKVGCGIDSQILGDFEIIGQVKKSYEQSLEMKTSDSFLDRLINSVIQASRKVKVDTNLSSGTTSVSYAGVQYIRNNFSDLSSKSILLYGTGKLGRNTCENLIKHSNHDAITLVNRSTEKAQLLGEKFDVKVVDHDHLISQIAKSNIVFVATGAPTPTITTDHITSTDPILILDLSIPRNVEIEVGNLPNVTLLHMDELSQLTNETLKNRAEKLPQAYAVMEEIMEEFYDWVESRKMIPTIQALNNQLKVYKDHELKKISKTSDSYQHEQMMVITDKIVQKLTGKFASYLRNNSQELDKDLDFIKEVFKLEEVRHYE